MQGLLRRRGLLGRMFAAWPMGPRSSKEDRLRGLAYGMSPRRLGSRRVLSGAMGAPESTAVMNSLPCMEVFEVGCHSRLSAQSMLEAGRGAAKIR